MATTEEYKVLEDWADDPNRIISRCIIDLRRRVEALEALAAEPAQRHPINPRIGVLNASIKASMDRFQAFAADLPDPAPAPAANRPLWEMMDEAYNLATTSTRTFSGRYAAEIDAVADWLDALNPVHLGAVFALRSEARRARESQ